MKKIFSLFSALLILSGIKAQQPTVKKETVKPVADSAIPVSNKVNKAASTSIKKSQKEWKVAPAIKKSVEYKNAPAVKEFKNVSIKK